MAEKFNPFAEADDDEDLEEEERSQSFFEIEKPVEEPAETRDLLSILRGEKEDDEPSSTFMELMGISTPESEDAENAENEEVATIESDQTTADTHEFSLDTSAAPTAPELPDHGSGEAESVQEPVMASQENFGSDGSADSQGEASSSQSKSPEPAPESTAFPVGGESVSQESDSRDIIEDKAPAPETSQEIPQTEEEALAPPTSVEVPPVEAMPEAETEIISHEDEEPVSDIPVEATPDIDDNQIPEAPEPSIPEASTDGHEDTLPPEADSSSPEPEEDPEEAERRVEALMGEDEGSEDEEPPEPPETIDGHPEGEMPDPAESSQRHAEAQVNANQEAAGNGLGLLALLVGAREIFKRRKGDRLNKEALAKHEKAQQERDQTVDSRQAKTEREITELKNAQDRLEPTHLEQDVKQGLQGETPIVRLESSSDIPTEESIREVLTETRNPQVVPTEVTESFFIRSEDGEKVQERDFGLLHTETIAENDIERAQAVNNIETDGELAFETKNETVSQLPKDALPPAEADSHERATPISQVLQSHETFQDARTRAGLDGAPETEHKQLSSSEEYVSSIKAGVTIGLIIIVLIGIFFIFK